MRRARGPGDAGPMTRHRLVSVAALGAALALPLAACGSSSSDSKPAYCSDRDALQKSVSGITDVSFDAGAISQLETSFKSVDQDAQQLVASAKGDFPSETGAISNATEDLRNAVKDVQSSPSASSIAAVASGVGSVVTSVKDFTSATKDACS
jgi:cytochrome c556